MPVAWSDAQRPMLVVAPGLDAAAADRESPLRVTADGFAAAGRALGALGLPTVVVHEGGLVRRALHGVAAGVWSFCRDIGGQDSTPPGPLPQSGRSPA